MHIMTDVDVDHADAAVSIEDKLVLCIKESLDLFLLDNARFLAERLVAQRPDDVRRPLRNNTDACMT